MTSHSPSRHEPSAVEQLAVAAASAVDADVVDTAAALLQALDDGQGELLIDDVVADLLPMVYRRAVDRRDCGSALNDERAVDVLDEVIDTFAIDHQRSWAEAQLLLSRARPLHEELERRGSKPVMLKGAAMLSSAYHGDLGARPVADFDLLIEPDHVDGIVDWALRNGWRVDHGLELGDVRAVHHAVDLVTDRGGAVDVHWALLANSRDPVRDAQVRADARPAQLASLEVRVPSPTHHLLHTLAHVKPKGLRHVVDVITIVRTDGPAIDWNGMVTEIIERRVVASTLRTVATIEGYAPDTIPAWVTTALETAPRHWSDYSFHGEALGSRREILRRFAAELSSRSRGADRRTRARIARSMVSRYGQRHGLEVAGVVRSFVRDGHRGLDVER